MSNFNVDSANGELTPFPISSILTPFQICTQVGTTVLTSSTSAGLVIILPNWAEKILGWHYPMDPMTNTFGTPEPIAFSLDIDQFYERFRLISAIYTVQAGTVSTTNAALSGSMNAVEAYNSLASLQGNGTTVYQIYSYGNAMGLTPDVSRRVGAVPSWKGVSLIHLNTPRKQWSRLEDSTNFTPSVYVNAQSSAFKFVDTNESYDLSGRIAWNLPAVNSFNTTLGPQSIFWNSGPILVDAVRSCPLSWATGAQVSITNTDATSIYATKHMSFTTKYYMRDIAGVIMNEGILDITHFEISQSYGQVALLKSGSFPTNLNIDETALVPPIRTLEIVIELRAEAPGEGSWNFNFIEQPRTNLSVPVNNGLVPGLIQNPLLVTYAGVEVGTKISLTGNLRLETIADSSTAKFVTPLYRKCKLLEECAITKVLSNPLHYGIKFIVPADQLQANVDLIGSAISAQVEKGVDKVLASFQHAKKAAEVGAPEASIKSMIKKGFRAMKKVGKEEFDDIIKPAAHEILNDIKGLGMNSAKKVLSAAMESLLAGSPVAMTTYNAPKISYPSMNQSKINAQAAAGWVGPSFSAMTRIVKQDCAQEKVKVETPEKDKERIFSFATNEVTLFPALYLDKDDQFVEMNIDGTKTIGSIFAVAPVRGRNMPLDSIRTRVGNHSVYNYTATHAEPGVTPIDPGDDVGCFLVRAANEECVECVVPHKPVTGRSLDLAMWAYQRHLKNGIVYSGEIEAGKVLALPVSTVVLKKALVDKNGLILCANAPSIQSSNFVQCSELISLAPTLLRLNKKRVFPTNENWLAATDVLVLDDVVTQEILQRWFNVGQLNEEMHIYYEPEQRKLYTRGFPDYLPKPNFKYCFVGEVRPSMVWDMIDWEIKLSIGEAHRFQLDLARTLSFDSTFMDNHSYTAIACAATRPCAAIKINSPATLALLLEGAVTSPWYGDLKSNDDKTRKQAFQALSNWIYGETVPNEKNLTKYKQGKTAKLPLVSVARSRKIKPKDNSEEEGARVTRSEARRKIFQSFISKWKAAYRDNPIAFNDLKMYELAHRKVIALPPDAVKRMESLILDEVYFWPAVEAMTKELKDVK